MNMKPSKSLAMRQPNVRMHWSSRRMAHECLSMLETGGKGQNQEQGPGDVDKGSTPLKYVCLNRNSRGEIT